MIGAKRKIDASRVKAAIEAAEQQSSGQIVVSVAGFFWGDVQRAADRAFERLGVAKTRQRNGVLLFVVPSRRKLVVVGDQGIHDKVGTPFWQTIVLRISELFRNRDLTTGLVEGIEGIGAALAAHFPRRADDTNELPDVILRV